MSKSETRYILQSFFQVYSNIGHIYCFAQYAVDPFEGH